MSIGGLSRVRLDGRFNQRESSTFWCPDPKEDIIAVLTTQRLPEAEKKFAKDLIVYHDYKIKEGERIRNERKQLNF